MKWSVLGLMVLGIIAAVCAAGLIAILPGARTQASDLIGEPREVTVLVAARDIPAMSPIPADAVIATTIAAGQAPADHLSDAVQAVGKVLAVPLIKGQALTTTCFVPEGTGLNLATALPKGKRAVSVALRNYAGLEGLLYPGAQVDVLAAFKLPANAETNGKAISTTLLQGVQVLAVHNETINSPREAEEADTKRTTPTRSNDDVLVTLLLNSRQAEAMQLAMEHGTVTLALRNPLDDDSTETEATLLSEGRLAKLASALSSNVQSDNTDAADVIKELVGAAPPVVPQPEATQAPKPEVAPPTAEVVAPPAPAPAPAPAPLWQVQILRGVTAETRSFPMDEARTNETPAAATTEAPQT